MVRAAILAEANPERHVDRQSRDQRRSWFGWMPILLLPTGVIALRSLFLSWELMWLLAVAVFAGCKWQTWWQARSNGPLSPDWKLSASYFLLWPGMDPQEFFAVSASRLRTPASEWIAAVGKTLAGVALIWTGARLISLHHAMLGGWMGMLGLVLFLHFGIFQLLALAWQRAGHPVKPIMRKPLASRSLSELWGKRWNLGFRQLSHAWVFEPLLKRFGPAAATLAAFLASGLLHDLVISVPARAGYGLPTAYFLLQGCGVIAERSKIGRRIGLDEGAKGFAWTALFAIGPLYILFHPWFVMRVMDPFLRAVAG
jgi:hypothetical protein